MHVVLIVLAFLNGEPSGKLPEVVYPDIATCVADWKVHEKDFPPDEGGTTVVLCVSDSEVRQVR